MENAPLSDTDPYRFNHPGPAKIAGSTRMDRFLFPLSPSNYILSLSSLSFCCDFEFCESKPIL
jgi:hypothetical protein